MDSAWKDYAVHPSRVTESAGLCSSQVHMKSRSHSRVSFEPEVTAPPVQQTTLLPLGHVHFECMATLSCILIGIPQNQE